MHENCEAPAPMTENGWMLIEMGAVIQKAVYRAIMFAFLTIVAIWALLGIIYLFWTLAQPIH
jgi:hypothetical protein